MSAIFASPFIIPVVAILAGVVAMGFKSWEKVREQEMAHELKLREMELEAARLRANKAE